MMKDRLQELKENVEIYGNGEDLSIINHFAVIDMEGPFMGDFFYKVNFLGNAIDKLTELVDIIERLQHAMLAPLPDIKIKNKLEERMLEIRQLGNNVRKHLKEIKQIQERETTNHEKNARQRIMEAHMNIITERFCNIMNKYYGLVIVHQERCKTRIARQSQLAGINKSDSEIDKLLEDGHLALYPEIIIQEKQLLNDMEERHLDIMKIEDSIRELHDMFIELADIVDQQGMHVSSIEKHVTEAGVYIGKVPEILPPLNSNRLGEKKKICLIIIFISLMVIFLVYLTKSIRII